MEHRSPPLWLGLMIAEGYRGITDMGLKIRKARKSPVRCRKEQRGLNNSSYLSNGKRLSY